MDIRNIIVLFVVVTEMTCTTKADCIQVEECVSDLEPSKCKSGNFLVEHGDPPICCPTCKPFDVGFCGTTRPCAPGLRCENRACVIDTESCFHTIHLTDLKPKYPPKCNPDGTYAPVQCKGGYQIGRCFCSDSKGNRIFGMAWESDAEDMTCACSRRRSDLENNGRNNVTMHCTENGNYEELQCDSGLCWCANPKTGRPVSRVVKDDLVSELPCYVPERFGRQYQRLCESKYFAISGIRNVLAYHGTKEVTMENVFCDYDGTYGFYQIERGVAYCSWKDGKRIGAWATDASQNLGEVNCNCARDFKYFEEAGKAFSMSCLGNGNYMPLQQINGEKYCVDSDGIPLTSEGVELTC